MTAGSGVMASEKKTVEYPITLQARNEPNIERGVRNCQIILPKTLDISPPVVCNGGGAGSVSLRRNREMDENQRE
jgi:hypothetical protein